MTQFEMMQTLRDRLELRGHTLGPWEEHRERGWQYRAQCSVCGDRVYLSGRRTAGYAVLNPCRPAPSVTPAAASPGDAPVQSSPSSPLRTCGAAEGQGPHQQGLQGRA